jgi:hypothetical protein
VRPLGRVGVKIRRKSYIVLILFLH